MINRGEKEKEVAKKDIDIPMEIDEIKGVGQTYGNKHQIPAMIDQQMDEVVKPQIPGTAIVIPEGLKIDIPNHIKQEINKKLDSKISDMKYEI